MNIENYLLKFNYESGRNGHTPNAIVLHIAEGNEASVTSWFNNPTAKVSSHYLIMLDGRILNYVDPKDTAWSNGNLNNPDVTNVRVKKWVDQKTVDINFNPNWETTSIEHEGNSGAVMPDAQFNASIELIKYLCTTYNITPDRTHVIGHYQLDSVTRAHCPGFNVGMWNKYMEALNPTYTPVVTDRAPLKYVYDPATNQTIEPTIYDFWNNGGGVGMFGHPLKPVVKCTDGVLRQLFENCIIGYYTPDDKSKVGITRLEGLSNWYELLVK